MRRARTISPSLPRAVRGRATTVRASCWVSVDAPETRRRCQTAWTAARVMARGSMPGWTRKRRSSAATMAFGTRSPISESGTQRARCPSCARYSRRSTPWRSRTTSDTSGAAASRSGAGRSVKAAATARTSHGTREQGARDLEAAAEAGARQKGSPRGACGGEHHTGRSEGRAEGALGGETRRDHFGATVTEAAAVRPKTSGAYISSARAGGRMNVPWVVARARYR